MEPTHLTFPYAVNAKGIAATAIQDSEAEIANCVFNVASCIQGFREDSPEFGIADQTFQNIPLDLEALNEQITRWEPRADLTLSEQEEALNTAIRQITIEV